MTIEGPTLPIVANWRDSLHSELSVMLKDLFGARRFFIGLASELPPGTMAPGLHGVFNATLAAVIGFPMDACELTPQGILLNDREIIGQFVVPEDAEGYFNGMVAHEAGHLVEFLIDHHGFCDVPDCVAKAVPNVRKALQETCEVEPSTPWLWHGPQFIRAALHIAYRLRKSGFYCPVSQVFDGRNYSLSAADAYWSAGGIQEEAEALVELPISEVLSRVPPNELTALFQKDTDQFDHENREQCDNVAVFQQAERRDGQDRIGKRQALQRVG